MTLFGVLDKLKSIAAILSLFSVAALAGIVGYQALTLPARISADLQRRGDALQATVDATRVDLARTQAGILERLASVERTADKRLASLERTADARLAAVQSDAREQIAGAVTRADARLGDGIVEIGRLRADLKPVLADVDEVLQQTSGTIAVLRPEALGSMAAFKVSMGHFGQMSRTANRAFPDILAGVNRVVGNSDRTTDATAKVMSNLAEATRPLPKWIRYPLAVTGAIAPTAAGAIGAAAATGAFR